MLGSLNRNHYLYFTAHYINDGWTLKKEISFRKFEFLHIASNLSQSIKTIFTTFGIEIFFYFDNVTENTTTIECLKTYKKPILDEKLFNI